MALPAPRLDDRSFQDLVDDTKRFIQERCPEWTDHNVSDPGITLVESFAWMTDLLLYRLNRVPDRVYTKFLELIGVQLFQPSPAIVPIDFRITSEIDNTVIVPRGTVVATKRTPLDPAIEFSTAHDLEIEPAEVTFVGTAGADGQLRRRTDRLGMGDPFPAFSAVPEIDDAIYIGFDKAIPDHFVMLDFEVDQGRGTGTKEGLEPLRWEAAGPDSTWIRCDWTDNTRGFNLNGRVVVYLPSAHLLQQVADEEVALLRCRVVDPADENKTPYEASPRIENVTGRTLGATVDAVNARFVRGEILAVSTGVGGQEYQLQNAPVVTSDEAFVVHITRPPLDEELPSDGPDLPRAEPEPWSTETWELVSSFADSSATDKHFTLDRVTGTVRFGPMVRDEDGGVRQYGAIPKKGATIAVPRYRVGGGKQGNVTAGAVTVLKDSVPGVSDTVMNRQAGSGGVDGETVEEAQVRGPVSLRTRNRAVTAEDFEALTKEADPQVRRVKCMEDVSSDDPSGVRVLIVPSVSITNGVIDAEGLSPSAALNLRIEEFLGRRRLVGTRVRVEPAQYRGVRVRARVIAERDADPRLVHDRIQEALHSYFNPLIGGPEGRGWEFGRDVRIGEVYSTLQAVAGLDIVEEASLFYCDYRTGEEETEMPNGFELAPNQLVVSNGHQIEVG